LTQRSTQVGVSRRRVKECLVVSVTDAPPADVAAEITALQAALGQVLPAKAADNLLIGTWNVRAFDRVAATWRTSAGDSPIRDLSNVACIAEIVRRLDVIAIRGAPVGAGVPGDDAAARPGLGLPGH
jgi:hypothetical protein